MKRRIDFGNCFPSGYEYKKEQAAAGFLLTLGAVLSLQYFGRLHGHWQLLHDLLLAYKDTVLPEDIEAAPFLQLAGEYSALFLPYFFFLTIMAVYHYAYYYRESRSIYLMRRLPQRYVLAKSCLQAPLLGMAMGIAVMLALGLLYYGAYLLVIPVQCNPRFL